LFEHLDVRRSAVVRIGFDGGIARTLCSLELEPFNAQ